MAFTPSATLGSVNACLGEFVLGSIETAGSPENWFTSKARASASFVGSVKYLGARQDITVVASVQWNGTAIPYSVTPARVTHLQVQVLTKGSADARITRLAVAVLSTNTADPPWHQDYFTFAGQSAASWAGTVTLQGSFASAGVASAEFDAGSGGFLHGEFQFTGITTAQFLVGLDAVLYPCLTGGGTAVSVRFPNFVY